MVRANGYNVPSKNSHGGWATCCAKMATEMASQRWGEDDIGGLANEVHVRGVDAW